ncbi:MAG: hypothetical protein AAFX04_14270 [Pseudomonadota bacterium]
MTMPHYMKNYSRRILMFIGAYMVILFAGLSYAKQGDPPQLALVALAIATALPICGVFWTIFRLLIECDDEYQRLLIAKQVLMATAFTLVIATVWQFLKVYDVLEAGPQWIGVIWLAMFGLAAPFARWRA